MKAGRVLDCCFLALAALCFPSSSHPLSDTQPQTRSASKSSPSSDYGRPINIATIKNKDVTESSGLVASRISPGIYWTHNDSGDGPFLYAFDSSGRNCGVWRVSGAQAIDWEDIAAGPGPKPNTSYLYVGDIGDNDSARDTIVIYRFPEPKIPSASSPSTKRSPHLTEGTEVFHLRYPDGKHDAEALLVDPGTGDTYVITKVLLGRAVVYKASTPLTKGTTRTLQRVADLRIPSLFGGVITGGDVSPDGKRVALCDYFSGYELVLPRASRNFDDIWKQPVATIDLGKRSQGESIAYRLDGRALLATSEGKFSPVIQVLRRQ